MALAECEGRMFSASSDGSIRVWGGATLEHERTLRDEGDAEDGLWSLAAWEGHLISGHGRGLIRVWNVATGVRDRVLDGHTDDVLCLAVLGTGLVSGSFDMSVKVWAMGAGASWACERTLVGHAGDVKTLATWQGKVLSGSSDKSVRVWDVETGAHDATLTGHEGSVCGLAVHGDRLFSASRDGTIRVWGLGTWAALRTVQACPRGTGEFPWCLAVSGSHLISGSWIHGGQPGGLQVWSLETPERLYSLPQSTVVNALLAAHGRVWAGVERDVVLYGRWAA